MENEHHTSREHCPYEQIGVPLHTCAQTYTHYTCICCFSAHIKRCVDNERKERKEITKGRERKEGRREQKKEKEKEEREETRKAGTKRRGEAKQSKSMRETEQHNMSQALRNPGKATC